MERKNERVFYTLEDKTNTEIHSYSDAEIQQNLKKYEKKSRPRRSLMLAGFVVSMIVAVNCNTDPYSFISYVFVILFAAGELLSETLYWLNRKSAAGRWYVEDRCGSEKRNRDLLPKLCNHRPGFHSLLSSNRKGYDYWLQQCLVSG